MVKITACCDMHSRLTFYLSDGRHISIPDIMIPSLAKGNPQQRAAFKIAEDGQSIEWLELHVYIPIGYLLNPHEIEALNGDERHTDPHRAKKRRKT